MRIDKDRAMFAVASFVFMMDAFDFIYALASRATVVLDAAICAVYFTYAIFYFVNEKDRARKSKYLSALFAVLVASVLLASAFDILYFNAHSAPIIATPMIELLSSVPLVLPVALLIFLARAAYIQKVARKYRKAVRAFSYFLYFTAVVFLVIWYLSGWVFAPNALHFDDEGFITLNAANVFASGHNPYAANFSSIIHSNLSKTVQGVTLTTNNALVGFLSYPALSFLIFAPFALINSTGTYRFTYGGFYILFALFIFILMMATSFVLKDVHIKSPPVGVIIALLFMFSFFATISNFLMLALILIAMYKIESRHLWIVLGILASLQQEVWIAVLLFLIYTARNYGMKRGMYNLLGTALVFILINGYFIMLNPSAFARGILSTVNGSVSPSPFPVFGYLILKFCPLPLSESAIFFAALIVTLILFSYFNRKRLIPLFALLPLLFLFNGIPIYYVFFVSALVISMYMKEPYRKVTQA
jgi:uncharacterized membrane protein